MLGCNAKKVGTLFIKYAKFNEKCDIATISNYTKKTHDVLSVPYSSESPDEVVPT